MFGSTWMPSTREPAHKTATYHPRTRGRRRLPFVSHVPLASRVILRFVCHLVFLFLLLFLCSRSGLALHTIVEKVVCYEDIVNGCLFFFKVTPATFPYSYSRLTLVKSLHFI